MPLGCVLGPLDYQSQNKTGVTCLDEVWEWVNRPKHLFPGSFGKFTVGTMADKYLSLRHNLGPTYYSLLFRTFQRSVLMMYHTLLLLFIIMDATHRTSKQMSDAREWMQKCSKRNNILLPMLPSWTHRYSCCYHSYRNKGRVWHKCWTYAGGFLFVFDNTFPFYVYFYTREIIQSIQNHWRFRRASQIGFSNRSKI